MKKEDTVLSFVTKHFLLSAAAIAVTVLLCFSSVSETKAGTADKPDAWDIISQMTIGWNLGNSLDSVYWNDHPTPQQSATAWNNPEPNRELFQTVKNLGFNTVRIPVTWYQHMEYNSATDHYDIDEDWMTYVKNTVNYAYDLEMFVIINVHHENWINVDYFNDTNLQRAKKILKDVWEQISAEFADYDYHLIFEGMNEPRQTYDAAVEWGNGDENAWNYINILNSVFIDTVRSSSSAWNQNRLLMIPSYHATDNAEALHHLTIPSNAGNVAISVHAYEPYSFTMDTTEKHIYETNNQYGAYIPQLLTNVMNDLKEVQQSKGVPIVIGEFGASDFNNTEERVKWATDYITKAKEAGFVCVLWDNNANDNFASGENLGCINRADNQLYPNAQAVVHALTSAYQQNNSNAVPLYQSDGTQLAAWSGFTVTEDLSYINNRYNIAIVYKGTAAPRLVLENKYDYSWNVSIEASESSNGQIAYYRYADIAQSFSEYGVSIYDMGKLIVQAASDTEIYGVYAVPV